MLHEKCSINWGIMGSLVRGAGHKPTANCQREKGRKKYAILVDVNHLFRISSHYHV